MMVNWQGEREATLLQAYREELVERIGRAIISEGSVQPLLGLHLYRHSVPLERVYSVVDPSVCVVAQGSKEFLLGESHYRYDPFHYLLTTVDLPTIGQVLEASKERPFLSLRLSLDPGIVRSVMLEAGYASSRKSAGVRAVDVSLLDNKRFGEFLPTLIGVQKGTPLRCVSPEEEEEVRCCSGYLALWTYHCSFLQNNSGNLPELFCRLSVPTSAIISRISTLTNPSPTPEAGATLVFFD